MGVIDKNQKQGGNARQMPDFIPVTLEEMKKKSIGQTAVQLDFSEDAWEFAPPPPKGRYSLRLFLGSEGLQSAYINPDKPDDKDLFVTAPLMCKIVSDDAELNDSTIFTRVSTRLGRGKNISTMMGILVKGLGADKLLKAFGGKNTLTAYEQCLALSQWLKKEPTIEADLDWRASYQNEKGDWKVAFKSWDDFPDDPDNPGHKQHEVTVTNQQGGQETVRAQVQVVCFYAKGEESKKKGGKTAGPGLAPVMQFADAGIGKATTAGGGLGNIPPAVTAPQQAANAAPGPVVQQPAQPTSQQTQPAQPSDEDLAFMLSD